MSCVLGRTTFWRSLKFFLVHQLFNSILQCSLRPLIRKAFCLWITDSRVVYLHMLWIHIWLPFNYFEPKCSPCSPKSGHTRWPTLLAPGFVCLFLEFLPMKYRYFLFVEIWQLWTFKNIQNIPLRCLISIVTLMWFRVTMATRLWVCLWWYFQIGLNQDEDPPWKWEAPSHGLESQMEWRRKWAEPQPSPLCFWTAAAVWPHTEEVIPFLPRRTWLSNWELKPTGSSSACLCQAFWHREEKIN